MNLKHKIIVSTPIICLIIFLLLGFCFGLWHPGWAVFFLIPTMPIILGTKKIKNLYSVLCVVIYLLLGIIFGLWHPGWIIFLTIPVYKIFTSKNNEDDDDDDDDDDDVIIEIIEED